MPPRDAAALRAGEVRDWQTEAQRVDPSRILRVHKYREDSKVRPIIVEAAGRAADAALQLCTIRGRYVIRPISGIDPEGMTLADGTRFALPLFQRHLQGCRHLLAFVITIGPALDNRVIELINDVFEPLDALFLETAGWLSIEAATRVFARDIKRDLATIGYEMSLRMGPGYDYPLPDSDGRVRWDLEQQRELFGLFGDADLPVTLMDSCAMWPKMSRSGIYGLRPAAGAAP
ncbi:MAG: hypothetical protein Kow0058_10880 [Roseovarius sp.]